MLIDISLLMLQTYGGKRSDATTLATPPTLLVADSFSHVCDPLLGGSRAHQRPPCVRRFYQHHRHDKRASRKYGSDDENDPGVVTQVGSWVEMCLRGYPHPFVLKALCTCGHPVRTRELSLSTKANG